MTACDIVAKLVVVVIVKDIGIPIARKKRTLCYEHKNKGEDAVKSISAFVVVSCCYGSIGNKGVSLKLPASLPLFVASPLVASEDWHLSQISSPF